MSTSIRNISPGMQITHCATTGVKCTQNGDELYFLSSLGVLYSHVTDHEEGVCAVKLLGRDFNVCSKGMEQGEN